MASRMFRSASSRESPSLMQPGSVGTYAVKPPSSLGSSTILEVHDRSIARRLTVSPRRYSSKLRVISFGIQAVTNLVSSVSLCS